ncbi:MAG: hypothetical protein RBS88_07740 [Spongiibacteraceae bacterium]|jgi:hypothetical protein|nr:hypothetical protein [Spongiibacteraceae bacterium]
MPKAIVKALLDAEPVQTTVQVDTELNLPAQQKQVLREATAFLAPEKTALVLGDEESPVDYATRIGYTKFEYTYEENGRQVVVDVLDPARAV